MKKKITIAIDAMGGENAPHKTIEGVSIFLNKNKNQDFFLIPFKCPPKSLFNGVAG